MLTEHEQEDDGRWHHRFGASWIKTTDLCAERARQEMYHELPNVETDASNVGTAVHAVIEANLDLWKEGEALSLVDSVELFNDEFSVAMQHPDFQWKKYTEKSARKFGGECVTAFYDEVLFTLPQEGRNEHRFVLPFVEDDERVIELSGTIDRVDTIIRDWKGLATDTPIPTPSGWTTMGELAVGDLVYGAKGRPCRVTEKSAIHTRPCYRLTFDDGSSLVADNVHLWSTNIGVLSTVAIRSALKTSAVWIENAQPLDALIPAPLPLDPYLLGLWLGDGSSAAGRMHCSHEDQPEIFGAFTEGGFTLGTFNGSISRGIVGLQARLSELGVLGRKHIPAPYLRASIPDRLALLQGLMDTDGTWNATRGQACFDNSNGALADGVHELVCSLGMRASVFDGQKEIGRPYRRIAFTPDGFNPFRLRRKANAASTEGSIKSRRRYIKGIEPTLTVPTQCIQVDAPDSLYLAGRQMVPTHNTNGSRKYEEWEYRRNATQPTVYTWAGVQLGLTEADENGEVPFEYVVMMKNEVHRFTVLRHPGHWQAMQQKVTHLALLIESGLEQWPVNYDSALCSPKWCPAWSGCRGKFLGDEPW